MFDPDAPKKEKAAESLLSLARRPDPAARPSASPSPASPSLVSLASKSDASERHRKARSRREAMPNPLLAALAEKRETPAEAAAPASTPAPEPPPSPAGSPRVASRIAWDEPDQGRTGGDDQWRPLLDPVKIFNGIVSSRAIIAGTTVAGAALGVVIAMQTPKMYQSTSELLIDPRDIKVVERDLTQGGLPSDATLAIVQNQVRVLTSGNVLEKTVDKLKLDADPEFNGEAKSFGIGSIISELRSIVSRGDAGAGNRQRQLAVEHLYESLDVERGDKTFVVSVGVTTRDPEKSALIANTLTDVFMQSYGDMQSNAAGRANDELTSRLAELQASVEAAERKVETYRAENDLIDAKGGLISDEEILKLNDQLTTARARTIELNARAASARNLDLDSVLGGELPEQVASSLMTELRTQYAASKQELERISVRFGPRHPERMAAEAQLAGARQSINAEMRRIVSSIQVDLKRAVQLEQDLASRLAQLKSRQGTVSDDLVQLRELERDAASKRAVYESFLLRARETGEQRGLNTANVSVISVAQPPLTAKGPSRSMIVIAATALGLLAGIGIGALRGALDSLRDAGPSAPSGRSRVRRRRQEDEIDSIMASAAPSWATGGVRAEAPDQQPAQPDTPSDTSKEQPVQSPYPPQYPSPQAWHDQQMAAWQEQQAAAWQEAQRRAAQQAWMPPQPQPYAHAYYAPQPPAMPQQPWPAYPPAGFAPPPYAQPAYPPQPAYAPPQPPQAYPVQAWPQPAQQPPVAPSAVDEIRESLREFRDAVRDLTQFRARASR